jgi:hypothetical protein
MGSLKFSRLCEFGFKMFFEYCISWVPNPQQLPLLPQKSPRMIPYGTYLYGLGGAESVLELVFWMKVMKQCSTFEMFTSFVSRLH